MEPILVLKVFLPSFLSCLCRHSKNKDKNHVTTYKLILSSNRSYVILPVEVIEPTWCILWIYTPFVTQMHAQVYYIYYSLLTHTEAHLHIHKLSLCKNYTKSLLVAAVIERDRTRIVGVKFETWESWFASRSPLAHIFTPFTHHPFSEVSLFNLVSIRRYNLNHDTWHI